MQAVHLHARHKTIDDASRSGNGIRNCAPRLWKSLCIGQEFLKHCCEQKKASSAGRPFCATHEAARGEASSHDEGRTKRAYEKRKGEKYTQRIQRKGSVTAAWSAEMGRGNE